jgi:uncharacterized RDD family membrane protein YckC
MQQAGGPPAGGRQPATVPAGVRMVTPEAVSLQFETANVGSRGVAFLLDSVLVTAGLFAIAMAAATLDGLSGGDLPTWVGVSLLTVVFPAWLFGYFIAQEALWRGRTLGKAALGLRVVTREGGPVRFRHAFIRGVLLLFDVYVTSGFVAVATILLSRANQRLGDMVAGTLVLRERSGTRAPAPVTFAPPPGLEPYVALLDTSGLDQPEYQAVRSFLLRAPALAPAARGQLAVTLAGSLADRVRPSPPDGIPPEVFLQAVAAAHQQRQRSRWPAAPAPAAGWGAAPQVPVLQQPPPAPAPPAPPAPAGGPRPADRPATEASRRPGPTPPDAGFAPPD